MAELRWGAATDPGRVRKANEDSLLAVTYAFAVADGMGGHAAGEVASAIALQTVESRMGQEPATVASVTDVVRAANEAVFRRSVEEPASRGMGTTLTLIAPAAGADGRDHLVVANVGDSRAYLLADGQLRQLTRDHSYVEEMLAAGQITAEEARRHPHRHVVTRALGVEQSVAVDTWLVTPEPGDRYLLCSDGLVNEVSDEAIADIITGAAGPQAAAEALVVAANAAGGRDNISVVVIEVVEAQGRSSHGPTDGSTTAPLERVEAEALGGWLPHDLAHGFDEPEATTADTSDATAPLAAAETTATPAPPAAKRRRVTGKAIIFTAFVAAVFVVALVVTAAFGRSGYYVGFRGDSVAVFQGRPGGVLWFQPTVESVSDLTRAELTADFQTRIARNPTFSSRSAADIYLRQLADDERALVAVTTTTAVTVPKPSPSTPSSTNTVPGSTSTVP
jgi:PPM family protein phosphatase